MDKAICETCKYVSNIFKDERKERPYEFFCMKLQTYFIGTIVCNHYQENGKRCLNST